MKKIINNIKYIKFKDLFAPIIFILVLPISLVYKLYLSVTKKELWLICEDPNEACDNGYHLFKYIRENHPNCNVYYAINTKSIYYKKVEKYGNIIAFFSFKHWFYYLSATKNISTHKYGNPNPPLFYILHVMLGLFNNRIFLQHGITMNDSKWLYYKNTKFKTIICAAKPEYEFIKSKFGYPQDYVKYLGFPRFDNLNRKRINKKQIVIMPTWRNWLGRDTNDSNQTEKFTKSEFFKKYYSLLTNKELINFIEKENLTVFFFPHRNMQKYIDFFQIKSKNIKLVTSKDMDIQDLLIEPAFMITDYSSVALDFGYMQKPVIYYQFDQKEFREKQLQEGYYSYENNGFGPVIKNEEGVIKYIIKSYNEDFNIEKKYLKVIEDFFEINDSNNCKRIYEFLKESD